MTIDHISYERAHEAAVVDVLADSKGRLIEHVREGGEDFVRRTYPHDGPGAHELQEQRKRFTTMNSRTGIALARSRLLIEGGENPTILVTEYLGQQSPESHAARTFTLSQKIRLARSLGLLTVVMEDTLPGDQGYRAGDFVIHPVEQTPVMRSVDPDVRIGSSPIQRQQWQMQFIRQAVTTIGELARDDLELGALSGAFCKESKPALVDGCGTGLVASFTSMAILGKDVTPGLLTEIGIYEH